MRINERVSHWKHIKGLTELLKGTLVIAKTNDQETIKDKTTYGH